MESAVLVFDKKTRNYIYCDRNNAASSDSSELGKHVSLPRPARGSTAKSTVALCCWKSPNLQDLKDTKKLPIHCYDGNLQRIKIKPSDRDAFDRISDTAPSLPSDSRQSERDSFDRLGSDFSKNVRESSIPPVTQEARMEEIRQLDFGILAGVLLVLIILGLGFFYYRTQNPSSKDHKTDEKKPDKGKEVAKN